MAHGKLTRKEYLRTKDVLAFPTKYIKGIDDKLMELNIIKFAHKPKDWVKPTYLFDMYDNKGKFKKEWYDVDMEKDRIPRQTLLSKACRDTRGQLNVSYGTDMRNRLSNVSESTIRRYISHGWLIRAGNGLILTATGYKKI